jgi:hypothetical protein
MRLVGEHHPAHRPDVMRPAAMMRAEAAPGSRRCAAVEPRERGFEVAVGDRANVDFVRAAAGGRTARRDREDVADRGTSHATDPAMRPQPLGHTAGGENPKQRVDRELHELLEEIRVALPGVELLFGFLLILPFSERFDVLGAPQRAIYLVCLLATAAATALFISPSAQHRVGFRALNKERLLIRMNRRVIAGLILVAVAISLATALIVWIVFAPTWALVIGLGTAAWFIAWWFFVPPFWRWRRVFRDEMSSDHDSGDEADGNVDAAGGGALGPTGLGAPRCPSGSHSLGEGGSR